MEICLYAFMSYVVEFLHWLSSVYSLQMIHSEFLGSGKQLDVSHNWLCTVLAQMSNVLKSDPDKIPVAIDWIWHKALKFSSHHILLHLMSDVGDLLSFFKTILIL
jgi:hypothetical protein